MSAPLPLPTAADLPPHEAQRLRERPPLNVYRMVANVPGCLVPVTDLIKGLYQGKLSGRLREIAIVRQAARSGAPYELHQHKLVARAVGLTEAEIDELVALGPVPSFSPDEQLVCEMCDQLESSATLDEATYEKARAAFTPEIYMELSLLIATYCFIGRYLNATRVPIEATNPLENAKSPN